MNLMSEKVLLFGSNSKVLAGGIAKLLDLTPVRLEVKKFPDGELYVRIDADVKGKDVVIVQTMFPNQNDSLIEFILAVDAAKDLGAKNITGVVPYLAYSRQDKRFQPTEAWSIKTVAEMLKAAGLNKLITVDTHYKHVKPGEFDFFGIPSINLSAAKILLEDVEKKIGKDFITIGPDFGSSEMIKYAIGKKIVMQKEKVCPDCGKKYSQCICRGSKRKYEISFKSEQNFKGKNVFVLDDIIASGGTMIRAIEKVKSDGAKKVTAAATHGLFLKDSLIKLKELTNYLIVTDSISTPVSNVSLAPLIAEALK